MIKVDVISGFLGAGKTTFIKKLLEEIYKGQKVVLIENEFGEIGVDGDFLKAKETTLGADNGIAVAMILAILESDTIPHPPIEAVFTSDEEIGQALAVVARQNRMTVEQLKPYFSPEFEAAVERSVLTTKVMGLIRENAVIEE